MSPFTQLSRSLSIATPLGDDVLGLRSIRVHEKLSGGFTIEAEMLSADHDIKFDDIVGHPVSIRLALGDSEMRYWHAYVARFQWTGTQGEHSTYSALLVPWFWLLSRSSNCRIFQNISVPEIVQQVFRDCGGKDFSLSLSGSYPSLEYCAQYRETEYDFVSRLLEQEGIAYYYRHTKAKGSLVLADEKAAYDPLPHYSALHFRAPSERDRHRDTVYAWTSEQELVATGFALTDYNPLKPQESLLRTAKVERSHGTNDRQLFDYPGSYDSPAEAERLSRVRLDEVQSTSVVVRGRTKCCALGVGHLFNLVEHPRKDQNQEYLVTEMELSYDAGEFVSGRAASAPSSDCAFIAIPSSQTYRPPRVTPKPVIRGLQPALVVGPSGEEIHTDKHGRVKVSFFWDRVSTADEKSSCWLRVAQGWAGKKMGGFFLPRIGNEVLVSFLEGDPDRPIVTGSVYNALNTPPYALPDQKTKSTVKTLSSKGAGGYNELRFEDKKGDEEIHMRAEKDLDIQVNNDERKYVGQDLHLHVKRDRFEEVEKNVSEKIGENYTGEVDKNFNLTIKEEASVEIVKKLSLTVHDDVVETFGKKHHEETTDQYYLTAKEIVIEAGEHITIQVGESFIAIDKDGISLGTKGTFDIKALKDTKFESDTGAISMKAKAGNVGIEGAGGVKVESKGNTELKGAMMNVSGDAVTTIKGGVIKIN